MKESQWYDNERHVKDNITMKPDNSEKLVASIEMTVFYTIVVWYEFYDMWGSILRLILDIVHY